MNFPGKKRIPADDDPLPWVFLAGRSNSGKSSLLNTIMGLKRSKGAPVSKKPGRTRRADFYRVDGKYHIVDLPGYGYARLSKGRRSLWEGEILELLSDDRARLLLLLADIRRDPSKEELELAALVGEEGIDLVPVLTKADKANRSGRAASVRRWREALGPDPIVTSSRKREGTAEIRRCIIARLGGGDRG